MNIKRIGFLIPNGKIITEPPVEVLRVSSALEHWGYWVSISDATISGGSRDDVIKRMGNPFPDVVGVYCDTIEDFNKFKPFLDIMNNNKSMIVLMGNYGSCDYDRILQGWRNITYIIIGQPEYIFPKLMQCIDSGQPISTVSGIAFRKDGDVVKTQKSPTISNFKDLPNPAYHLVDVAKYFRYRIIPEYGCAVNYECPFNHIMRGKIGIRPILDILHEIKFLYNRYGVKPVNIDGKINIDDEESLNLFIDFISQTNVDISWVGVTSNNKHVGNETLDFYGRHGCKGIVINESDKNCEKMIKFIVI